MMVDSTTCIISMGAQRRSAHSVLVNQKWQMKSWRLRHMSSSSLSFANCHGRLLDLPDPLLGDAVDAADLLQRLAPGTGRPPACAAASALDLPARAAYPAPAAASPCWPRSPEQRSLLRSLRRCRRPRPGSPPEQTRQKSLIVKPCTAKHDAVMVEVNTTNYVCCLIPISK